MEAYLWFDGMNGEPPIQWKNYLLMKHVFHCTPSELKKQKPQDVAAVLVCLDVEARISHAKGQVGAPGIV